MFINGYLSLSLSILYYIVPDISIDIVNKHVPDILCTLYIVPDIQMCYNQDEKNVFYWQMEAEKRMNIIYSKTALKFLAKADKPTVMRIRAAIQGLTNTPPDGDIKIMQGYSDGRQRLRVGKYRVIFKYTTDNEIEIVYIIDIGSRGDIYK